MCLRRQIQAPLLVRTASVIDPCKSNDELSPSSPFLTIANGSAIAMYILINFFPTPFNQFVARTLLWQQQQKWKATRILQVLAAESYL